MSQEHEKLPQTEEQKRNNSYSFIVGCIIAMAIIIAFALLFNR
jgi:hypothetical protein